MKSTRILSSVFTILTLAFGLSLASAQDPSFVTEGATAVSNFSGYVTTLVPAVLGLAVLIKGGPFVIRYIFRFIK